MFSMIGWRRKVAGSTTMTTDMFGNRMSQHREVIGDRTLTDTGSGRTMVGFGSQTKTSDGLPIIMAAGLWWPGPAGFGCQEINGLPRGSHGVKRKTTSYVGWAPLPPEASFSVNVGFQPWCDSYYGIGPACLRLYTDRRFLSSFIRAIFRIPSTGPDADQPDEERHEYYL